MKHMSTLNIVPLAVILGLNGRSSYKSVHIRSDDGNSLILYQLDSSLLEGDSLRYIMTNGDGDKLLFHAVDRGFLVGQDCTRAPLDKIAKL